MNVNIVQNFMNRTNYYLPTMFINNQFELILDKEDNIYTYIKDVETELDMKCKALEAMTRRAIKGGTKLKRENMRMAIYSYIGERWTLEELELIYTKLGNRVNRPLTEEFVKSGYDLDLLRRIANE